MEEGKARRSVLILSVILTALLVVNSLVTISGCSPPAAATHNDTISASGYSPLLVASSPTPPAYDLPEKPPSPLSLYLASTWGEGRLYRAGGRFNLLELHGSYYQMGMQYGALLKEDLARLYAAAVDEFLIGKKNLTLQKILAWVDPRYSLYPDQIKNFLFGMAEATEIDLEKLIVLSLLTDLARIPAPAATGGGCSSIAVWGPYTAGRTLIVGRNFDWWWKYRDFARYLSVTVFNPSGGGNPFASIGWAGELSLHTGLNAAGVFLSSNDGEISGGDVYLEDRVHPSVECNLHMESSDTLDQLGAAISSEPLARSMIINIADKTVSRSYECSVSETRLRQPDDDGLLVATNHYIDPGWTNISSPGDKVYSETRRKNLLTLAGRYKGSFDPQTMMKVMETSIENGGPSYDATVYQVIAVPESFRVWIAAAAYSDWVEIDLKPHFNPN